MALTDESQRPPHLRRAVQRVVRAMGLHIGRFPPVDSLAYHLRAVLRVLEIDCVFDVGAHVGEYGKSLRDIGYRGRIVSFEPVAASFAALSRAAAGDAGWRVVHAALGAADAEMEMNVYRGTVFNSFLKTNAYGAERFDKATELVRTEKVSVRRLEDFIDEELAAHPGARLVLKTDTQGYDFEVFKGAGERLAAIRALQTEQAARPTYEGMPTFPEALAQLNRLGFEISGIFPVARDRDHLRVIEFDCVMTRPT